MSTDFRQIPLDSLIPQRDPFRLISSIESADSGKIVSLFEVEEGTVLVENGYLSESGMLENIAQSAAAMVGLEFWKQNTPVPLGFIGGISKVAVHALPPVGAKLRTEVEILNEVFNMTLIQGKCYWEDKLLLVCQMKIVVDP